MKVKEALISDEEMLCGDYCRDRERLRSLLGAERSFDVVERRLALGKWESTYLYIDGFVKDGEMQRIMQMLIGMQGPCDTDSVMRSLPYVEVDVAGGVGRIVNAVLSGQTVILCESFGPRAILVDARTYPSRGPQEPQSDRVMLGARDGFVETLIFNTALIRRRIRDPRLTVEHITLKGSSATDIALCYMEGLADGKLLDSIRSRLRSIAPRGVPLGYRSVAEALIGRGWLDPFPKLRLTERPDTASAHILEGSVILLTDTCPQAMILPTSFFDFMQQTDDFYFPPLTGSYLRLVRIAILLLSVVITPLWYLAVEQGPSLPEALRFLYPDDPGALPIILQLILVELAVDGLKIASMNTPDMLSSSLSVIGALILGDYAVSIGWLCEDVILYMAFVAIASFAQQNAELGYAFKFFRVVTLLLVYLFGFIGLGVLGLVLGLALMAVALALNNTLVGRGKYLYPLIPFNGSALMRLLFRMKKNDVEEIEN